MPIIAENIAERLVLKVTWTAGLNAGAVMEVKSHANSGAAVSFELWETMPFDVQAGDTFTVTAGCDKTLGMCRDRFGNLPNFRGFPFIPGNDAMTAYPNDGQSIVGGGEGGFG